MNDFDLASAQRAAADGRLEAWVHDYLLGPGQNPEFSRGLRLEPRRWYGPAQIALDRLTRSCGPEPGLPFHEPAEYWIPAVRRLALAPAALEAFPPLLVRYADGRFVVTDGNHRHAAFRLRGLTTCWTILGYPNPEEYVRHEAEGFASAAREGR